MNKEEFLQKLSKLDDSTHPLNKLISHSESEMSEETALLHCCLLDYQFEVFELKEYIKSLTEEVQSLKMKIKQLQEENNYSKATEFLNDILKNIDKR